MTFLDAYYRFKPLIPRSLQIKVRRAIARKKLAAARAVWPIDHTSASPPEEWHGWPNGKRFALVLNHDVETARGYSLCLNLMEIERQLNFRSSFYFVPEGYDVSPSLRCHLTEAGFDVGVHGLRHDGKLFRTRKIFNERAPRINSYLKAWGTNGFSSPSMHRNLDWVSELDIVYDLSTFDTDPFEPQPQGARTIFPFWVPGKSDHEGFVELPYTLPQDHCLFVILRETDNRIWKEKLDWVAENGGMALINSHPDYMNFKGGKCALEEYPVGHYVDFLKYARCRYESQYWHVLSKEIAGFLAAQPSFRARTVDIACSLIGAQ